MSTSLDKLLEKALKIYQEKGYVVADDIFALKRQAGLSFGEFEQLLSLIQNNGILLYDEPPEKADENLNSDDDNIVDSAQFDYDSLFDFIEKKYPDLRFFMRYVRNIVPAQYGEFVDLQRELASGNVFARKRIIDVHLRQAIRLAAKRAEVFSLELEDTINDACSGLIVGVDKYDPKVNGNLSSYLVTWIYQYMQRNGNCQNPCLYYPVAVLNDYFKIYPKLKKYVESTGREICFNEFFLEYIQKELDCDEQYASFILRACLPSISIFDETYAEELASHYHDIYHNNGDFENELEDNMIDVILRQEILESLSFLKKNEREVITLRYGLLDDKNRTLAEVGDIFGITRERVRQIEAKALKRLATRQTFKKKILR